MLDRYACLGLDSPATTDLLAQDYGSVVSAVYVYKSFDHRRWMQGLKAFDGVWVHTALSQIANLVLEKHCFCPHCC